MVILARQSRGITQSDFAKRVGVTQGTISKIEQGLHEVTDDVLEPMSQILNYPIEFFLEPDRIYPAFSYHRKRQSLKQKLIDQIEAQMNVHKLHIRKLLESAEFDNDIPFYSIEEYKSPSEVARALRQYWNIPKGPIENVTSIHEKAGIPILHCDFGTKLLDGISLITQDLIPLIFVNKDIPGDRLRFTLAHELGHIIMHRTYTDKMEDEADQFAAEFLMPASDIRADLAGITLEKLVSLKMYWKTSMSSLLKRAGDLKKITERSARYMWMNMGKKGFRIVEPVEIPKEEPTLVKYLIRLHIDELGYSVDQLSKLIRISTEEFSEMYDAKQKGLRLLK